ncbi:caprin homolog [Aedes albopictus]|uniref:Caprin-1 dimerization domain-containing protein n=1 Tax=Aedes albopictus TaxID=7160 RepID=A0ABM1XKZ1_AEDAL|nr:caprin homolog [Aedes albopictus]
MPSLKVIDNSKISTPESFANAPESGGSDECNVSKEAANHSQSATNSSGNNNGNAKEQPASPLQQIVLIIEHKIRNLEKRKNKLESYRSIEKSGKKLTGDQKTAVSKYDECLTSLELTRELCKQFQTIVATANKEAKKEAKRSVFIRAQQENAKIREVLIVQDVLKRFTEETVREDFREGTNGACKIADSDLLLLDQLYEETLANRPKTTAEPTFVTAVKQAADHFSAIVDGRNKPFGDVTYMHLKNVIAEIQNCGYFEKDIMTVQEDDAENVEEKEETVEAEGSEVVEELQELESVAMAEPISLSKVEPEPVPIAPVAMTIEAPNMKVFAEAPAATAVPTPSFPTQPSVVRQVTPNISSSVPEVVAAPNLVAPPVHIPTQLINANSGLPAVNTPNMHSAAPIIVPTGPVAVPMMQPAAATPLPSVPAQQLNATTVQAVENAYFKQHYIQQQMRPIHEVIGTGNFFFLQESEIDKPDVISSTVPFGNPMNSNNVAAQPPHPQVLMGQAPNASNQPTPIDQQQGVSAQPSTAMINAPHQQPNMMMGNQQSNFNNQPFQNLASPGVPKTYQHPLQSQTMETRQMSQPMNAIPHSRSPIVSKAPELGHIPGFTTSHTTVVSTQSVPNKEQSTPSIPQEDLMVQSNAQRQPVQKSQLPQQNPMVGQQQTAGMNTPFNSNLQQYPSLVQNMHESPNTAVNANLPGLMVDATADKLKTSLNLSDKYPMNQSHLNQQHQQQQHTTKLRHDEWSRPSSDYAPNMPKAEDQWSSSSMAARTGSPSSKPQYNSISNQQKPPQSVTIANESTVPNVVNEPQIKRHEQQQQQPPQPQQQNDNMTSSYGQDLQATHGATSHQLHQSQGGHRSSARSAPSSQYQQNNGTNARFDNGINNTSSTFFKNNDRFYQQNQTNNYGSNKSDSSYHQRGPMLRNRNDNGNPPPRGAGYNSATGGNNQSTGGTANNGSNSSGNFGSGMDYRSNARPVNSTRNTGPPSARPHQRNHSGNSYGGPRGGSNSRAQSSINA